jgi:hypothetical protein
MTLASNLVGRRVNDAIQVSYKNANIVAAIEIHNSDQNTKQVSEMISKLKRNQRPVLVIAIQ